MVKVAAIQRSSSGSKEHNIEETVRLAHKSASLHPGLDLIMFPEYNNYLAPDSAKSFASSETIDGNYVSALREAAITLNVNIHTGSFAERAANGKVLNTALVIDRRGDIIGRYSKLHLSDAMGFRESDYVAAGDQLGLVDTDFGRIGLLICYDMRFPELPRSLALSGADILCVSALWPCGNPLPSRIDHWDVLTRATAIQNLSYVVACNQFGKIISETPFGRSCIIDPWGTVVAQAGEGTQIIYSDLDMAYLRRIRENVATYENRRPDVYML